MSMESLRTALADRYTIERELGAGGMATVQHYFVMPVVEGESLRARMDREGPLAVDEAVRRPTVAGTRRPVPCFGWSRHGADLVS